MSEFFFMIGQSLLVLAGCAATVMISVIIAKATLGCVMSVWMGGSCW